MKKVLFAVLMAAMVIGNAAAIDITFGTVPDSWGGALDDNVKQQIVLSDFIKRHIIVKVSKPVIRAYKEAIRSAFVNNTNH